MNDLKPFIRLGISTCLLGESVRYDGGHKLDRFLRDILGEYVEYVPVCPEVEAGFDTPREAFRLVGNPESPRFITARTKIDYTDRMTAWASKRVKELEKEDLCGYVFKSKSPSSGMERVKVYNAQGMPMKVGVGVFARAFMDHFPNLPVEEEGRLNDPRLRENFIERIFALARWKGLVEQRKTRGNLVRFHTQQKLLILSHSPKHYQELGRLVARAKEIPPTRLYDEYQRLMLEGLKLMATARKHCNVLQHCLGYFKQQLSADEKQELLGRIDEYRKGYVPLIVPITLINHYVRKYDQPYLKEQYYLHPHPMELKLRNHV
jgi:uncharacterized protein YbgA (DUF1722 family)/uncharacterized protein YbbK (DUF523 family)